MKYLYCVLDGLTLSYREQILVESNDFSAYRTFLCLFPEQFRRTLALKRVGVFNPETGLLEPTEPVDINEKFLSDNDPTGMLEVIKNGTNFTR